MHERTVGIGHNQPPPAFLIRPQPDLDQVEAQIFLRRALGPTSAPAHRTEWVLRFERQRSPFLDPLTGWTGGDDPQAFVELAFRSREEAIRYAERQGLSWRIIADPSRRTRRAGPRLPDQRTRLEPGVDQDAGTVAWLSLGQGTYGRGNRVGLPDLDRAFVCPASVFASPEDVVRHPRLTIDCKREILRRWAWDEYLIDLAVADGMPEGEPSRLPDVKAALRLLNTEWSPDPAAPAAFVVAYEPLEFPVAA
jgi:hypothetical protein